MNTVRIFRYNARLQNMTEHKSNVQNPEELMSDRLLDLFFWRVLTKENLQPLRQFVDDREGVSAVDPIEISGLTELLHHPITGPMHEVEQWRFADRPYVFAFKGWRQDHFPKPDLEGLGASYGRIYESIREYELEGTGFVTVDDLKELLVKLEAVYDQVADEIDPRLKAVWLENNLKKYEPFEGRVEGLPGRLTPAFVDAKLRQLRSYRQRFAQETGSMRKRIVPNPPSRN